MKSALTWGAWWALLGAAGLGLSACHALEDELPNPSGNPFLPVLLEKDSFGATMRHPFHTLRTTWVDYFKTWAGPREDHQAVSLEQVRSEPKFYLAKKLEIDVYLNKRGSFFRQFTSPFTRELHVNFSAWPYATELWNREVRTDVFPFFYVTRENDKLIRKLDGLAPYTPLHVWSEVITVSEGYPWIEITDAEPIPEPAHTVNALRDLELGMRRMEKKDWSLAITTLHAAQENNLPAPTQLKVYEALGKCHAELRQYHSAREALIAGLKLYGHARIQLPDALKKDDRCVKALVLLAQVDLKLDRDDEARDAAGIAVAIKPNHPVAHAELGLALAKTGDIRNGLLRVDASQRLAPEGRLPEAHRNRAQIFLIQDNKEAARSEQEQAIILRPNDVLYHLELGDIYLSLNQHADAQREYENGKSLAPDRPEPLYKLALVLKAQGDVAGAAGKKEDAARFYQQALDACIQCEQKDDLYSPVYATHAELLRILGKPEDAKKILEKGAKAAPKSLIMQTVLFDEARTLSDWETMERSAMSTVLLRSHDAAAHARLADVRAYKQPAPDWAGAEAEYAVAAKLDSGNAAHWARLANIRRKLQRWEMGAEAAEKAVSLDAKHYHAWCDLAECRRQDGNRGGAVEAAERAFALQDNVPSRVNLAIAYLDRAPDADEDRALALAKTAVGDAQGEEEKAAAQSVLGAALQRAGSCEEAKAAFSAADAQLKDDPWHNLWSGRSLLSCNDSAGAKERFDQALKAATADTSGSRLMQKIAYEARKGLKSVEEHQGIKVETERKSTDLQREKELQEAEAAARAQQAQTQSEAKAKEQAEKEAAAEAKKKADDAKKAEEDAKKKAEMENQSGTRANKPPVIEVESVQPAGHDRETSVKTR